MVLKACCFKHSQSKSTTCNEELASSVTLHFIAKHCSYLISSLAIIFCFFIEDFPKSLFLFPYITLRDIIVIAPVK